MQIVPAEQFKQELLRRINDREFKERTGVHCSDLIYCLNKQALRRLKPLPTSEDNLLLFSLGWATQRWLTGQDEDESGEEQNGIIVTLDAFHEGVPWELKASFQSSERPIEENQHHIRQVMAQCYITGTTEAYLSRLEIMGDWKSIFKVKGYKDLTAEDKMAYDLAHRKPTLHAFKLTFTPDELARNWAWLCDRRDKFQHILDTSKLLPKVEAIPSGQEFECGYCPYKGKECVW